VAVAVMGGGEAGIVHLFPLSLSLFIVSSLILSCRKTLLLAAWEKLHNGVTLVLTYAYIYGHRSIYTLGRYPHQHLR